MFEEHRHEGPLPGLKLLTMPVNGRFGEGSSRQFFGIDLLKAHFYPLGDPLDFFDDGIW